jgi:hypothetical protein
MPSLGELQTPDDRTLRFTPLGFATAHKLRPEAAADLQQSAVDVGLVDAVPEQVRGSFDRVRMLHAYGVLSYELFTAAHDLTRLILEQALRTRFVEFYDGTIPFVAKDRTPAPLAATNFDVIYSALNSGSHRKARRLVVGRGPEIMDFRGSLNDLLAWARAHGLLAGQRNRMLERVLVEMRNDVAHPTQDHLVMPVNSAQAIRDLGEIINRLWGVCAPDGRLYPGSRRRDVIAIGRNADATSITWLLADGLAAAADEEITEYILVRASANEHDLWSFDARHETLTLPSEYLWGPGSRDDAIVHLQTARPQADEVDHLDRLFLIRETSDGVDRPLRPEAYAALNPNDRAGTWHLVLADHPGDAVHHVRRLVEGDEDCASAGPCKHCPVEIRLTANWNDVLAAYEDGAGVIERRSLPDVRVQHP